MMQSRQVRNNSKGDEVLQTPCRASLIRTATLDFLAVLNRKQIYVVHKMTAK
jgi:hypothetical protein